jgi:hypothetical protein
MSKRLNVIPLSVLFIVVASGITTAQQFDFAHEPAAPNGYGTAIALDAKDKPHIVYWDYNNQTLNYTTFEGGIWTNEVIEATAFTGAELSIAIDASGVPHVSYHNYTASFEVLRYAVRTGGVWMTETVVNGSGRYNDIAIDSQGRPHISYYHPGVGARLAVKNGGWSYETAYSDVGQTVGLYTSIALGADDTPYISFLKLTPAQTVAFVTRPAATWLGGVDYDNVDPGYTAIALTNQGTPVILYTFSGGELRTIEPVTGGGLAVKTVTSSAVASLPVDLAIDDDNNRHVAYTDLSFSVYAPYHAFLEPGQPAVLQRVAFDVIRDTGKYISLGLDQRGLPHMSFQDETTGDIVYALSGIRLKSPQGGETWPVGATRTVSWLGVGEVDINLSTDGGNTYERIATDATGGGNTNGGQYDFVVPHAPSRFCKIKIERGYPFSVSETESLFTIELNIALIQMAAVYQDTENLVTWETRPGPDDLAGYRLERRRNSAPWSTIVTLTKETAYHDTQGRPGDEYRLFAVNNFGQEFEIGESQAGSSPPLSRLRVHPNPYHAGDMIVTFATTGGLGGGSGSARVAVYDIAGRLVRVLVDDAFPQGVHTTRWDGRTSTGHRSAAGVYFVKAESGGTVSTQKVTIVR